MKWWRIQSLNTSAIKTLLNPYLFQSEEKNDLIVFEEISWMQKWKIFNKLIFLLNNGGNRANKMREYKINMLQMI